VVWDHGRESDVLVGTDLFWNNNASDLFDKRVVRRTDTV
jgi:hypothetical protein